MTELISFVKPDLPAKACWHFFAASYASRVASYVQLQTELCSTSLPPVRLPTHDGRSLP